MGGTESGKEENERQRKGQHRRREIQEIKLERRNNKQERGRREREGGRGVNLCAGVCACLCAGRAPSPP